MWEDIKGFLKGILKFIARGLLAFILFLAVAGLGDFTDLVNIKTDAAFGVVVGSWFLGETLLWCYRTLKS